MEVIFSILIVLAIYTFIALKAGSALLSYRSAWLDAPVMPNRLVKAVLCIIVGYITAIFYLGWIFFKFILKLTFR